MANILAGLIATALVIAFIGGLAISIGSFPFAIIAIAVLAMAVVDFFENIKDNNGKAGS